MNRSTDHLLHSVLCRAAAAGVAQKIMSSIRSRSKRALQSRYGDTHIPVINCYMTVSVTETHGVCVENKDEVKEMRAPNSHDLRESDLFVILLWLYSLV